MASYKITVEIPILLTFFTFMLTGSVYTNLIIYRTCYLVFGYNQSECALLGNTYNNVTEKLEKIVEPEAAWVNTVRSMTESLFTIVICLFIGPWSDRFGRKPILLLSLAGFTLTYVLTSIFSYCSNLSPWFSIACSIPMMLAGGGPTYLTVVSSYITDITTDENRGIRMAIFEAIIAIGIFLGNVSSSYIFHATNYPSVFAIAAGSCALGILYTFYFIPESLEHVETEGKFKSFFQISNAMEMIKTSVKRRENYKRAIILLTITITSIYIFILNGDGAVSFFFLRSKFDWTLTKFTLYNSAHNVAWILGTILGTYFLHKLLNVVESVMVLMGFLSMLNCVLMMGLATNDWHIYAAGIVRSLGGVISPMLRSLISKLVSVEEIGKIFSLIMASEFLLSLGSSPLYTLVYNDTINKDPAIYNFMSAGFYMVNIVLIIAIMYMQFISPSYSRLENEEPVIDENDPVIN